MATVTQQLIEFPFRTDGGAPFIGTPSHLLAALRRSALPSGPPKGLVLLSGHASVYRLGLCAAVDRALAGEPVLYLAGANVFDPFFVGRLAKASLGSGAGAAADSCVACVHLPSDGSVGDGLPPIGVEHL